jgi:excisionase family DNA binding protein
MSQGEDAAKRRDGVTTRRAISPNELALQLGVSPASALRACKQGRVRCVRFGKRYLIPADEADRILNAGIPPATAGLPPSDSND